MLLLFLFVFSLINFYAWRFSNRLVQLQHVVDVDLFVCFCGFRVPDQESENTVAACHLLQFSRNTSHTQYMCTVDMTLLLADLKVQVDVTEITERKHVISKDFYMAENSKYKNGRFDKYCLSICSDSLGKEWAWQPVTGGYVWCALTYTETVL